MIRATPLMLVRRAAWHRLPATIVDCMWRLALAIVVVTGLVASAAAFGAVVMTFDVVPRPAKASSKTKLRPLTVQTKFTIRDDTGVQPSPLRRIVIRFQRGATLNWRLFPKCSLAALRRRGRSACPRGSVIGRGTGAGSAQPIIANVPADVTMFNGAPIDGKPSILFEVRPAIASAFSGAGTVRLGASGQAALTVEIPPIPTLPGYPNAAIVSANLRTLNVFVRRKVAVRVRGRRVRRTVRVPYIGAPRVCNGTWTSEGTFSFESGEAITLAATHPCRK
jgi:hypothetical protein